MKNRKTRSAMRRMLFTLALVLVVAVASVGGTIAWLTDKTDAVTNTFTVGDINIDLYETKYPNGTDKMVDGKVTRLTPNEWEAKLIPGSQYAKNPVVTVKANSEKCYLFVKFEEINNPSNYLEYSSNLKETEWMRLDQDANNNVWYRVVESSTNDQSWNLLAGNQVTVKDTIVKSGTTGTAAPVMPTNDNAPQLKYTAYAIQFENMTDAADAWSKVSGT